MLVLRGYRRLLQKRTDAALSGEGPLRGIGIFCCWDPHVSIVCLVLGVAGRFVAVFLHEMSGQYRRLNAKERRSVRTRRCILA